MPSEHINELREKHETICEFDFNIVPLEKGYANRTLRIDLNKNEIKVLPVTQQMKDLWVGGKGFDLWLMFQEINKNTKWDSPENPICFASGPLAGTTSFPGSGKTIVTTISPATHSIMDSNVGGYFGPYFKFCGFDALTIVGKATDETIILIDAIKQKITIEKAPLESIDSHLAAEEFTEMYADNDLDMRNIAVVSSGTAAIHSRMGLLNFSFWDWRRGVARLKQAGRGGIGTVFRDKNLKALIVKNRGITPAWRIEENKVAKYVTPNKIEHKECPKTKEKINNIISKWNNDPEYIVEMMNEIQDEFRHIPKVAIDQLNNFTGTPKSHIYHMATFYKSYTLEQKAETTIQVCTGAGCHAKGAGIILDAFENHLGIKTGEVTKDNKYGLEAAPCLGACEIAPVVKIGDQLVGKVKPKDVNDLLNKEFDSSESTKENIAHEQHNFQTFKDLLKDPHPENIIQKITDSGLQGRGGGGFLVGHKWKSCFEKTKSNNEVTPYLICNSAIFEPSPGKVIEGMLIGALAVGAKEGYLCYRYEHKEALKRMEKAIQNARSQGILGKNILATNFSFDLKVRHGAGGFVIGESSALIASISGQVGVPKPKYIHNSEVGFRDMPTIVNNIETWATIPLIFNKDQSNLNTKLFSLSGDVKNIGTFEVPLGTSLKEIIDQYGKGIPKKRKVKAVQIGGPSGGFIPEKFLDTKVDFLSLKDINCMIGSGMISVKNERKCIIDSVKYSVDFLLEESCGKCTPCREGLYALKNLYNRIGQGKAKEEDLNIINEIANTLQSSSLCQLGKTAANPVLTSLEHFKDEYLEHIINKKCPSGVCKPLVQFSINDNCTGCTLCAKNCPTGAITGEAKKQHFLDQKKCIKCGVCFEVCNFKAVEVE